MDGLADGIPERREYDIEELATIVVDAAFHIHRDLGPGLLESVYETVLARSLERRGLYVRRQAAVTFAFDGIVFDDGLRVDVLVNDLLVVELNLWKRSYRYIPSSY
jgi:iron complex transport system substrate-binding protein